MNYRGSIGNFFPILKVPAQTDRIAGIVDGFGGDEALRSSVYPRSRPVCRAAGFIDNRFTVVAGGLLGRQPPGVGWGFFEGSVDLVMGSDLQKEEIVFRAFLVGDEFEQDAEVISGAARPDAGQTALELMGGELGCEGIGL